VWYVALNQALLSNCATTPRERSQPVQHPERGEKSDSGCKVVDDDADVV
jgi:hypothetical protein